MSAERITELERSIASWKSKLESPNFVYRKNRSMILEHIKRLEVELKEEKENVGT